MFEDWDEWIRSLKKDSKEKLILVEGKKDKKALTMLGIRPEAIITLKGKAMFKIVEEIVDYGKECIILFDLDKKGKELYAEISKLLRRFGIKVDNRYRNFLFKTKLRQIEGILHYLKTIEA
ncbi:topoisomerase [Candidatus Woesearchaeota archaeon]|nr:toprim domain-containing protein [Candidatus Woesearchaeota archaeon]RLE40311.1 MAG: topoisomerase [Candidatus Woesearchaeota archaeon]